MYRVLLPLFVVSATLSLANTIIVNEFKDDAVSAKLGEGAGILFADSLISALLNSSKFEVLDVDTIKELNEIAKDTGMELKTFDYLVTGTITSCTKGTSKTGIKISSAETTKITITCSVKIIEASTAKIVYCKVYEGESINVKSNFGVGSIFDVTGHTIKEFGKSEAAVSTGDSVKYFGNEVLGDLKKGDPDNPYNVAARDVIRKITSDITLSF